MGVVRPMARALESELADKFGVAVTLKFDNYPMDMVSRAQVFSKLAAVEGVSPAMAMALSRRLETAMADDPAIRATRSGY